MNDVNLDDYDREPFREAGEVMRWVGIFWIVLAGLIAAGTLLSLISLVAARSSMASLLNPLLLLFDQAVLVAAGVYTVLTAATLRRVATEAATAQATSAQGSSEPTDRIGTVMKALEQLRGVFTLYAVFVGLSVLTEVIALVKG